MESRAFVPRDIKVSTQKIIKDSRGNTWRIVGDPLPGFWWMNGYRREEDGFFWPADPSVESDFGRGYQLPPTVEAVKRRNERHGLK